MKYDSKLFEHGSLPMPVPKEESRKMVDMKMVGREDFISAPWEGAESPIRR
jgi:hypothetical protein